MTTGFIASSTELGELQSILDDFCARHGVTQSERRDDVARRLMEHYAKGTRSRKALIINLESTASGLER